MFDEERQIDEENFQVQQKINIVELQIDANKQLNEQKQIIVVASFINKLANLGGLSRTCEIFNASGLAVSNANIVNESEFQALSMASHKILPIFEVKPEAVLEYLKDCRSKGFSIVAAEQTSRSGLKFFLINKSI